MSLPSEYAGKIGMSEPFDIEREPWFGELLAQLRTSGTDNDEGVELGRQFQRVLEKTLYPIILRVLRREFRETDGTTLKSIADREFAAARKSHEDRRPRECIRHLCFALAAYLLAGDMQDAATSLGNLGAGLADLHYYSDAIVVQRIALLCKERFQRDQANVVRSWFLIAQANYKLGNYTDAIVHLQKASELRHPNDERSDLERRTRNALELMGHWHEALDNPPYQAAECLADAEQHEAEERSSDALMSYARAAGRARLDEDAVIETRALLGAARLFYSPFNMHTEAAAQSAIAAALARKAGAVEDRVRACQLQGLALMECGEFSAASSAFEVGLGALPHESSSRMELELGTSLAFTLFCSGSPEEATRQLEHTLEKASLVEADEALQMWYLRSGQLFRAADHLEAAIRVLKAAAERFREAGIEGRGAADVCSELAQCYFVSERVDAAILTLDQAITFAEQAGDEESVGRNYVNMACTYLDMNNAELAVTALSQAESHVQVCNDEALNSYFTSVSMDAMNRRLVRARMAQTRHSDGATIAGAEEQAPAIHLLRAQIAEAERGQSVISREELACLYSELGAELDRARQFDESRQAFSSALRMAGVGNLRGNILQNYGVCLVRSGDIEAARSVFEAALASKDLFAEGADRLSSLVSLARVNLALHRRADYFSLAQQIETASADAPAHQRALYLAQVAELYEGSGHPTEALTSISGAVDLLRTQATETNETDTLVNVLAYAAKLERKHGNLAQAEEAGLEALKALETQRVYARTKPNSHWQANTLVATLALIDTLYQSGQARAVDALNILETGKARSILQRYGLWLVQQPANFPAELREKEHYFLTMLRHQDYFGETADPLARDMMQLIESDTYAKAQEFWDSLPEPWQAYGALRQGKPVNPLALIRKSRFSDETHFIVLLPADTQTLAWHLTQDGTLAAWTSIPIGHDAVMAIGQQTLSAAASLEPLPEAWHELSRELTRPWLSNVPEGSTVCFVPSRSAIELPFSLLESGDGYLFERNPIAILPTLSLLAYWAESRPRHAIHSPVVLGDSLSDLRNARMEAESVAIRLGTEALLGPEVIRGLINGPLEQCDLLHVSGHARFDHRSSERSGFVLADGGMFSPRDALKLRMNAHLAVLSGCESGRFNVEAADELTGVASSLLAAGMRSIVATSWPIPDNVTPILIDEFYNGLLGQQINIASALRTAQQKVFSDKRHSHPFYWASFRLLGDWRNNLIGDQQGSAPAPLSSQIDKNSLASGSTVCEATTASARTERCMHVAARIGMLADQSIISA
jgi:CHAT domain-containing protein